jgi:hypothetical protein
MDYQKRLDSLHQEIISTLCSIQDYPEGLFPFCVHVEEETDESLISGNTGYYLYNLTAICADGTCLLENPQTGREKKRGLHEICIDSLTELWDVYRSLAGEDAENNVTGLLQSMKSIVKALMTGKYITDFTVHDTDFIRRTNAKTPFVWMVYKSGTHLYNTDEKKEIRNCKSMLDHYINDSQSDFCLYRYDGHHLLPVFPKVMHEWIENQLKIETTNN